MLDIFASVGATRFDVTWTTRAGEKEWFRRSMSFADLRRTMPAMLDAAPAKQRNVIVRPHGPGVTFIQLDDLKADQLPKLVGGLRTHRVCRQAERKSGGRLPAALSRCQP
jgi:hypothetical protein